MTGQRTPDKKELRGVGGWLLVLIIGMVLVTPLSYFAIHFATISMIESSYPHLLQNAGWAREKTASSILLSACAAISMLGGIMLWQRHKRNTVYLAVSALWINGPVGIVLLAVIYNVSSPLKFLIQSLVPATLWTLYLFRSVRVKNTYADDASAARKSTTSPHNNNYRYRWSLYINHSGVPKYFLDADSVLTLIACVMPGFAGGRQPVQPWSLALIFNQTHQHIVLGQPHFERDGQNITPLLMEEIAAIAPDYEAEYGGKPVFSDANTGKWLEICNYRKYATLTPLEKFKSSLLDWGGEKPAMDFTSVFNKVFNRKSPAPGSTFKRPLTFLERIAANARQDGGHSSSYRATARKHANAFWAFLALSGIAWFFAPWFFAATAGALAAYCVVKSFSSSRVAHHMEKHESKR